VAHTLIVIGYHLQKNHSDYDELGGNYFDRLHSDGLKRYLVRRLQQLGHKVTLEPETRAIRMRSIPGILALQVLEQNEVATAR
jgi:hypothetical protein